MPAFKPHLIPSIKEYTGNTVDVCIRAPLKPVKGDWAGERGARDVVDEVLFRVGTDGFDGEDRVAPIPPS